MDHGEGRGGGAETDFDDADAPLNNSPEFVVGGKQMDGRYRIQKAWTGI